MPRRARVSKRRQADPLDVAGALAAADVFGCAAIPEHVTLEELAELHGRASKREGPTCWGWLAFVAKVEQPCAELMYADPWTGLTESAGVTCGGSCRFAAVAA